jgi:hypothetical protein
MIIAKFFPQENEILFENDLEQNPADLHIDFFADCPFYPFNLKFLKFNVLVENNNSFFSHSFPDSGHYVSTDSGRLASWSCSPDPMSEVKISVTFSGNDFEVTGFYEFFYNGPAFEEGHFWDGSQWVLEDSGSLAQADYEVE